MRTLLSLALLALAAPAFAQSSATVTTSGNGQRVLVDQSRSDQSVVQIDQIGTGGGTVSTQDGTGNQLRLVMSGDNQEHDVRQSSAGAAFADINSLGARNTSSIGQDVGAGATGNIFLLQNGQGNSAQLSQSVDAAGFSTLSLTQSGDDNIARLTQQGSDNLLTLSQEGNGLLADITQSGNGLQLQMTQTGDTGPIFITQTVMPTIGTVTK